MPSARSRLLIDHLSARRHHIRRNREIDLLRSFQIDDELELRRLLDGQIDGLGTFENFIHVVAARRSKSLKLTP